ncbi:OPT oligopeptide transporter protein-domain-containing protein [Russula dissimulans]|nr:OPT oligopeptide transporter protein-domain-containing protein [Russula dissimulans]
MEDLSKTTQSARPSDRAHIHGQDLIPDVPKDIEDELMRHFNDPNWDFRAKSSELTMSISSDGTRHEPWSRSSTHTTNMEVASESRFEVSSQTMQDSDVNFISGETQHQDSPYPEVRAAVANTDDPTMIVNTFRVWLIGLLFAMVTSAFNTVFSMRYPTTNIGVLFILLITLPFGKFMAWILPKRRISACGYSFSLNPGPFNIKEHALIVVMGNIASSGSAVTGIASNVRILYGERWSIGKQFLLGLAPQVLGFAFAGILRPFLVWPASMIWPDILVRCALLNTIHSNYDKKETRHISRQRFFYLVCLCSFLWSWIPGYLWTGLSVFTWMCWISPNNVIINSLFGSVNGLGMSMISFDWSVVSVFGSPLVVPWWAQLNMMSGFIVIIWIICPVLWAKNVFYSQFMPISAGIPFDNTGSRYNLSRIITNNEFDQANISTFASVRNTEKFIQSFQSFQSLQTSDRFLKAR